MKKLFLIAFMFIVPVSCSYEGVEDSNGRHVEKIPPININIEIIFQIFFSDISNFFIIPPQINFAP